MDIEIHVVNGSIIKPGDKLILAFPDALSKEQCANLKARVSAALPGVDCLVVGNGATVTVLTDDDAQG